MNLKFWTWGKTPTQGTSNGGTMYGITIPVGNREVYPSVTAGGAITYGFNSNTAVYSITKKAAKKFGSIMRVVEKKGQEGKAEDILLGKLTELLNRPNLIEGQDAFFAKAYGFFKVCGETFIWLNRGDTDEVDEETGQYTKVSDEAQAKKPVLEMFVLPTNQIIVLPDPEDAFGVYGYIWECGTRIPIRKTDIIHWKDLSLEGDIITRAYLRGWPALQSGAKTLEQNNSATDLSVRMNQNSGAKGALANRSMAPMNPKQESELRAVVDGKVNSNDVKNAIAAFQGDYVYLNFGLTSVDMQLLESKKLTWQELCFLLGMPYELFDSQTTYANKEMAQKAWIINEIMPDCKQLDGEMNRVLLKSFGLENTASICCDFDDMPELQTDKAKQVEWLSKAPIKVDEFREALGYEALGGDIGDMVIIPSGFVNIEDLQMGDGGEEILTSLYNANGTANRGNGNGKVPQGGKGA